MRKDKAVKEMRVSEASGANRFAVEREPWFSVKLVRMLVALCRVPRTDDMFGVICFHAGQGELGEERDGNPDDIGGFFRRFFDIAVFEDSYEGYLG